LLFSLDTLPFKEGEFMRAMIGCLVLFMSFEASANNLFIPNYYKNRRQANQFSAIGWSERHEAGAFVTRSTGEEELGGVKQEETEGTTVQPHIYHRFEQGLNLEATLTSLNSKTDDVVAPISTTKSNATALQANLGYEFQEQPMAIGVSLAAVNGKTKNETSNVSADIKTSTLGFGWGYRLDDDIYLGAGILSSEIEVGTVDASVQLYSLGIGKVYGDRTNPIAAVETYFLFSNELGDKMISWAVTGLVNSGDFQYYGGLNYGNQNGQTVDETSYGIKAGLDYQFGDFYAGPQFEYTVQNADNDVDDTASDTSLQLGYRTASLEIYARYNLTQEKNEVVPSTGNTKDDGNDITVAAIYKF
jgi:hypothetical protein